MAGEQPESTLPVPTFSTELGEPYMTIEMPPALLVTPQSQDQPTDDQEPGAPE